MKEFCYEHNPADYDQIIYDIYEVILEYSKPLDVLIKQFDPKAKNAENIYRIIFMHNCKKARKIAEKYS